MHITKPEHNETVQSAGYSSLDGGSASAPLSSGERECDAPTAETCCSTATDQTTAGVEPREPCPTPLAWQHVVRAVANESQAWELDRGEYVLRGRTFGTGKPLYFLNGLGGTHELYALTAWLLRDEFRCVLYDYPAAETKSARRAKLSVERLAADLFAAAGLHEDERFCVYAATFGTPLALQAALQQPGRIERAVLQGAFAHRRLSPAERLLAAVCRRLPGRLEQVPGRRVVQEQNHRRWFPPYDITRWRFLLENTGQVPA